MNRFDAIRMGAANPVTFPTIQVKEIQDELLLMSFDTYDRIQNALDQPYYYLDDESPVRYKSERFHTYMIEWFEWKSIKDKLKWEKILNEVIQG